MKRLNALMLLALLASTMSLAACNTIKGAGQDVQRAGEAVEDAADRTGNTDPQH